MRGNSSTVQVKGANATAELYWMEKDVALIIETPNVVIIDETRELDTEIIEIMSPSTKPC